MQPVDQFGSLESVCLNLSNKLRKMEGVRLHEPFKWFYLDLNTWKLLNMLTNALSLAILCDLYE